MGLVLALSRALATHTTSSAFHLFPFTSFTSSRPTFTRYQPITTRSLNRWQQNHCIDWRGRRGGRQIALTRDNARKKTPWGLLPLSESVYCHTTSQSVCLLSFTSRVSPSLSSFHLVDIFATNVTAHLYIFNHNTIGLAFNSIWITYTNGGGGDRSSLISDYETWPPWGASSVTAEQHRTPNKKQESWSRLDFLFHNGCVLH